MLPRRFSSRGSGHGLLEVLFFVALVGFSSRGRAVAAVEASRSVQTQKREGRAASPPRGWNSYDSFSWLVTEQEFLANTDFVAKHLLEHGYEYLVVDFLWYRKNETGASPHGGNDLIDEWGRLQPDPTRWPSSVGGFGFSKVAERVHSLGLKFGIHVMRGISLAAVNADTPIFQAQGAKVTSIARLDDPCRWMPKSFVGIKSSIPEGRAFLRSIYEQYASWGVDFVKHDCVFGGDLELEEVRTVSEVLASLSKPVLYSVSPGYGISQELAVEVGEYVNAYRVTGDTWDQWSQMRNHFDVARDFASAGWLGAPGLGGFSWPDLDMLPLGWLTDPDAKQGPHRQCVLTQTEQMTMLTLWAVAKSPIFYGGDLRSMDDFTLSIITNSIMLKINAESVDNQEVDVNYPTPDGKHQSAPAANVDSSDKRAWAANGPSGEVYLALFNLGKRRKTFAVPINQILQALGRGNSVSFWQCQGTEAWTHESLELEGGVLSIDVPSHGSYLYSLRCS